MRVGSELIWGPMFSGKTTELLNRIKKYLQCGKNAIVISYSGDTRYGREAMVSSHDGLRMIAIKTSSLKEDPEGIPEDATVIGIDECQFFEGLSEFCQRWNKKGVKVIAAGLHTTDKNNLWPNIVELLPHLCDITYCHAICIICGNDKASRSRSLLDKKDTILIGADDAYVATCYNCFDKPITSNHLNKRKENIQKIKSLFNFYP